MSSKQIIAAALSLCLLAAAPVPAWSSEFVPVPPEAAAPDQDSDNYYEAGPEEPGAINPDDTEDPPPVVERGECGKYGANLLWTLYSDGTLAISGGGK